MTKRNETDIKIALDKIRYSETKDFLALGDLTNELVQKLMVASNVDQDKLAKLKRYSKDATDSYGNPNIGDANFEEIRLFAFLFVKEHLGL